ncbi:MAG: hypothetical protein ACLSFR_00430 [Alphaproteobacteria bacterium]
MRYSSLLALCAFMFCLNTPEVRGEILAVHTYDVMTHTALLPKPVASDNTFSLAATWWLPDWQGSQGSRGSTDAGGGDIVNDDSDCMKYYNLYATCPSPKVSTGVVHPVAGMTCQKGCVCPSEYKYTSSNCSGKYTLSGGSCDGKYNACVCKSEYSQNSSNCNGEYQPAGEACGGNYNRCEMRPDCTVTSKDCTYGCDSYNSCSRCTSCKSNPDCDVSDKYCPYGCASYNSCSKCTSCNGNPDCDVTDKSCTYGCASTNSCGKCTSCETDPACDVTDRSCDYGCESYNSCGKCISCKSAPCDSSSSNWCSVHSTCHGDCCSDGSIEACDTRCGGSGCDGEYCSYQVVCQEGGGTWMGNNNCSIHCYIYAYTWSNYHCVQNGNSWDLMYTQHGYCFDDTTTSLFKDLGSSERLERSYSGKSECETAAAAAESSNANELEYQANNYPACARYRGYYLTDRYCGNW